MRCKFLLAVALVLLGAHACRAQYYGGMAVCSPCGPVVSAGTQQRVARIGQQGELQLWFGMSKPVYETVVKTVEEVQDGQKVQKQVTYTVCKMVGETAFRGLQLDEVKAYGLDRKRISSDRLAELLAEDTPVLICDHGQKIGATYLKLVKPDTIVLLMPAPQVAFAAPAPVAVFAPSPPAPAPPPVEDNAPPAPAPPVEAPSPVPVEAAPVPVEAAPVPPLPGENAVIDQPELPYAAQPTACLATIDGDGTLKLRSVQSTGVEVTAMKCDVQADGSQVCRPVSVKRSSRTEITEEIDAAEVQAFTVDGQEVSADELASRLAREVPVLVSGDGKSVDPLYLKIIRDDAIVLVVPVVQPAAPVIMPAMPVPAPPVEGAPPPPAA
jgi:hypothetical protein